MIGSVAVDPPLLMAPMAGFTDAGFRRLVRELGGCGLPATEMISARGFVSQSERNPDDPEPGRLWGIADEPRPLAAQIWDNDPGKLAMVGAVLAQQYHVSIVDINFGCPAPDVATRSQSGSFLLRDPERIGRLIERVVAACAPTPVTAKIRLGISLDDEPIENNAVNKDIFPLLDIVRASDDSMEPGNGAAAWRDRRVFEVARAAEEAGAAALTVHGRFASQMFAGHADWDRIAAVKEQLQRIPLIGNGDLDSAEKAATFLRRYPVNGVMIGRAALGQPWLFRQTAERLRPTAEQDPERLATPDPAEQRTMLLQLLEWTITRHGVAKGVVLMRKYACRWGTGRAGAREFRRLASRIRTPEEFESLVRKNF